MTQPTVQHLDLEPRAADFLELLRDLGHLDPTAMDSLTGELVRLGRPDRRVLFEDVRRMAASWLFDHEASLRPEQRDLLATEWARLFY
jgi:hypothetical protein